MASHRHYLCSSVAPLRGIAALVACAFALPATALDNHADEPTLEEVRALTEKYQNIEVALAEGFVRDPMNMCEMATNMGKPAEMGGMGIHFFRPDLLGINSDPEDRVNGNGTYTDFRAPAILIYEPRADGTLELVAVENLVFREAWHAAGHADPPSFQGVPYDLMEDDPETEVDEAHMFEPHYDRHVWVHRENPAGVFTPFNPAVTCQYHTAGH